MDPNRQPGIAVRLKGALKLRRELVRRALWRGCKTAGQRLGRPRSSDKVSVFVTGHQRSGTNMLMEAFERSAQTDVYHENDRRAFEEYIMRDRAVIRDLVDRSPARVVVVKGLCEAQDLPELLEEFTPARGIWMVRHYDDVVNSMVISFPKNLAIQKRIAEDRESGDWRTRGMSEETYRIVRSVVTPELTAADAAAIQWYYRNLLYFERELHTDERVILVQYERLVQHPFEEFGRIARFVGLENTPGLTSFLHGGSLRKKTAPEINPEIRALCDELWSRFEYLWARAS